MILDVAVPQFGPHSINAHASTLAFELTSGRRPVIVNCGSGLVFGRAWHKAGRGTSSHSTLSIEGKSSSNFVRRIGANTSKVEILTKGPSKVSVALEEGEIDRALTGRHDGYEKSFGLSHSRHLRITYDGRSVTGEDEVVALTPKSRKIYDRNRKSISGGSPAPFAIRFHLHPDVEVHSDRNRIILTLKSGELWSFSARGAESLSIEPSIYLEKGRLEPRESQQILLTGHVVDYSARISWEFSKSADTPDGLRDLGGLEVAENADDLEL